MIRESEFVQSHRPYAVRLGTFRPLDHMNRDGRDWKWYGIDAVWFRRRSIGYGPNRRMVTVACIGQLSDLQRQVPANAAEFLAAHDDGRHGGDCRARWDGTGFWSAIQDPETQAAHLAILRPMLAAYPACPETYSGWWRF